MKGSVCTAHHHCLEQSMEIKNSAKKQEFDRATSE